MSSTELTFESVSRSFGEVRALQEFSITITPGQLVTLLGPSGCGKTTALRIAAGFERADSGRVLMNGEDVTTMPPNKRGMGMVFQNYSLFPHLTVRGNVAFGLKVRGTDKSDTASAVDRMLDKVMLGSMADRYPHQLSGGQQQRVALARALAISPRVLLLDEPLSALDAKVRAELRDEIRQLQSEVGVGAIFVTHDQEEALGISDLVCVMRDGRIQQVGSPQDVYLRPANDFVARFVGAMNEIPGVVNANGGVSALGTEFDVRAVRPVGTRVVMLVRPDAVRLAPADRGVRAEVVGRHFSGSTSVVRLAVDAGGERVGVQAVTWSREVSVERGAHVGLEIDLANALVQDAG